MLINETEFTVVASEIMLYTMPFEKEYNWSALNTSDVSVSVVCLDFCNPNTLSDSIVAKVLTLMFLTVHNAPTLRVPLNDVFADETTTPEFFK